jgi:triosephosphate isomerase
MRKKIVAGNWKMNTTPEQGLKLAKEVKSLSAEAPADVELIIAPPFTHISSIANELKSCKVKLGSQNCSAWEKGAFTGEVSVEMLASSGVSHIIVGHSERREYFSESSKILLDKLMLVLKYGLTPIFCCGEKLDDRDANNHFNVVKSQIEEVLFHLNPDEMAKVVIAYEPVWAIGTGRTASPEQAEEIHGYIRNVIGKHFGNEIGQETSILYGGSCKPDNAKEIFAKPNVDGGLIGGASLVAIDFIAIAKSFPQ